MEKPNSNLTVTLTRHQMHNLREAARNDMMTRSTWARRVIVRALQAQGYPVEEPAEAAPPARVRSTRDLL